MIFEFLKLEENYFKNFYEIEKKSIIFIKKNISNEMEAKIVIVIIIIII